jgi:DNA transposition AAA+ family ATPase
MACGHGSKLALKISSAAFSYLVEAANQRHQGTEDFLVTRRFSHLIELLIVDEANRLRDAGLEVIRDLADRGEFGLVLLGMRTN